MPPASLVPISLSLRSWRAEIERNQQDEGVIIRALAHPAGRLGQGISRPRNSSASRLVTHTPTTSSLSLARVSQPLYLSQRPHGQGHRGRPGLHRVYSRCQTDRIHGSEPDLHDLQKYRLSSGSPERWWSFFLSDSKSHSTGLLCLRDKGTAFGPSLFPRPDGLYLSYGLGNTTWHTSRHSISPASPSLPPLPLSLLCATYSDCRLAKSHFRKPPPHRPGTTCRFRSTASRPSPP